MSKHTPGPWTVVGGTQIRGADASVVASVTQWVGQRVESSHLDSNARLIAAAPEILQAVKAADLMLSLLPVRDASEERARIETKRLLSAAINKAEGK